MKPMMLRRAGGAAVSHSTVMHSLGSSPYKNIAIAAIQANAANNLGMRDVSARLQRNEAVLAEAAVNETVKKKLTAKDLAGITGPLGFFDPLGFSADCSAGKLLFYREVELKHGRVAMLAALGILVGEQWHPLWGGNIDLPAYITFQFTPLQTFWPAVVAAIAIPEVFSVFTFEGPEKQVPELWAIKEGREPGDFSFDPLGLKPTDPKDLMEMQNKELNNGRLAMIAAAGMIAQELVTNQKLFDKPF